MPISNMLKNGYFRCYFLEGEGYSKTNLPNIDSYFGIFIYYNLIFIISPRQTLGLLEFIKNTKHFF